MRSDHWNFLANLLGTPGPAEPPIEAEKKEVEPKSPAESPVEEVIDAEASIETENAGRETAQPDHAAESDGASVLDALKATVPTELVPGFEATGRQDAEQTDAEPTSTPALDAAWGDLASELGVDAERTASSPASSIHQ